MDIRLIKRVIKLVEDSEIHELEVEEGDLRISVRKQSSSTLASYSSPQSWAGQPTGAIQSTSAPASSPEPTEPQPSDSKEGAVIPSPMVGTFYRAPSPESPAFVQVGSTVEEDTVVCILEAMKVMNEIKAGVRGKVVEVLVESGNPVEFGQPLFRVET